jgi:uncharacterized protein YcbX
VIKVSALKCFTVKSCAGISLEEARLNDRGIESDRNFMIVDSKGRFLTQRTDPRLSLIQPFVPFRSGHLVLNAPRMAELKVSRQWTSERPGRIWRYSDTVLDLGDGAADWLSQFLGKPCRLVMIHPHWIRKSDTGRVDIGFHDGFQFLLTSTASLEGLNKALVAKGESEVGMDRFRANIVISSDTAGELAAFAEDNWREIRIGNVTFDFQSLCKRCPVIDTDQLTADRNQDEEPRTTLAEIHKDGVPYFGINMNHRDSAPRLSVYVGDKVEIWQTN